MHTAEAAKGPRNVSVDILVIGLDSTPFVFISFLFIDDQPSPAAVSQRYMRNRSLLVKTWSRESCSLN